MASNVRSSGEEETPSSMENEKTPQINRLLRDIAERDICTVKFTGSSLFKELEHIEARTSKYRYNLLHFIIFSFY